VSIYPDFKPTFLYIKQHSATGLLYFGKSSQKCINRYKGSGTYWTSHIKKHGKSFVETIWFCLYVDQEELTKAAISFSNLWDIVLSEAWANLKIENGIDGTILGTKLSKESIAKRSATRKAKGYKPSKESIEAGIATKKINGTLKKTAESIAKFKMTRSINKSLNKNNRTLETSTKITNTRHANGCCNKKCTTDGITIFPSLKSLVKSLGQGKKGHKHPNFRYL
jgi:hypothetical protein